MWSWINLWLLIGLTEAKPIAQEIQIIRQNHRGDRVVDDLRTKRNEVSFNGITLDPSHTMNYALHVIDLKPRPSPVTEKECSEGLILISMKGGPREVICFGSPRAEKIAEALERLNFHTSQSPISK